MICISLIIDSVLDKSMVVGDELVVAPIREEEKDG